MSRRLILVALALAGGPCPVAPAQTLPVPDPTPSSSTAKPIPPNLKIQPDPANGTSSATNAAPSREATDRLAETNRDLLDLLKKQQLVLEDIQVDRRLQARRIETLLERLTDALKDNGQLQAQVASLQATAAARPAPTNSPTPPPSETPLARKQPPPPPADVPVRPASYLPPSPDERSMPGSYGWHRLFTLSGADSRNTDLFHVKGKTWRVVWHNQDKDGKAFANTSGLLIDAFPKNDTIPQKVCAKVGSGGETQELQGPGNFYLKIEASGGSWELAVEDLQ